MPTKTASATTEENALGYEDLTGLIALMTGDEKHEASSFSTIDVIWVLYDRVLHVDPKRPDDPDRDYFLLSKGHGPLAFYAILASKGYIDTEILPTFGAFDSPLGHHPDSTLLPGVEIASGSLGHGLPMAVGVAEGLRIQRREAQRVICLIGDGELDEGSNFEAMQYAGRAELGNLMVVVVDNNSSSHGWPGGIASRFEVEGWISRTVNGRDHDQLHRAFSHPQGSRPQVVVAQVEAHL